MNEERIWQLIKELKEVRIDFDKNSDEDKRKQRGLIAAKIKAYRIEHKLTQEELAKKLGIPKLQIIRWEGEDNMPGTLALAKLKSEGII